VTAEIDQLAKLLGMLGSAFDGEVLVAARKAHALVINNDWTWPQLLANGSASALTEEQINRVYAAGLQKGEIVGYQRGMADAQAMGTPPARARRSRSRTTSPGWSASLPLPSRPDRTGTWISSRPTSRSRCGRRPRGSAGARS
jgi:hypothetical protein